ncbi:cobalamin-binding protein [Thiomicrorhabdus sediminis]|uniref:cobalamin-binding protein n=1 Tax=Thiomicrorhabdus sediminis TaxID=2580412 RepID=UPI00143D0F7F|nr:cobalamin-binding protein [Thiomicrorhabdus sediminis]
MIQIAPFLNRYAKAVLLLCGLTGFSANGLANSDSNRDIQRIVSLSPHLTELVYSAGGGAKLVGAIEYSDYPAQAKSLPRVGNYQSINIERIIALKPDLILSWKNGNRARDIEKLQSLGFNVWQTQTNNLEDIGHLIAAIGKRLGTKKIAENKNRQLQKTLQDLSQQYAQREKISTFYQLWQRPLMTVNGSHFISLALNICGAENIFAELPLIAPEVSIESVINANPKLILLGGQKQFQQSWMQDWQTYDLISAVKNQQIYRLDNNLLQRPTERFIKALPELCRTIDQARLKMDE